MNDEVEAREAAKLWVEIADNRVRHFWQCNSTINHPGDYPQAVYVDPGFYMESGTPVCSCGLDMDYMHTEISLGS